MSDLILIAALFNSRRFYRKLLNFFPNAYFFRPDYDESSEVIVESLKKFLQDNDISKADFITHSYGSVILKLFFEKNPEKVGKCVLLAPVNERNTTIEAVAEKKLFRYFLGESISEYDSLKDKLKRIEYPEETLVIAGNKRFDWRHLEYLFIPLIFNNKDSDGKLLLEEAKVPGKKFIVVNESHTEIARSENVFEIAKEYLKQE